MALERDRASLELQLCQFMKELGQVTHPEYQFIHLKDEDEMIVLGITDYICIPGIQQAFNK